MEPLELLLLDTNEDLSSENSLWSRLPKLMEIIKADGASFFFKVDGERETSIFTILIQGGPLDDEYIRTETDDLLKGLNDVFSEYSSRF